MGFEAASGGVEEKGGVGGWGYVGWRALKSKKK